eukprot:COSAG05_NODE_4770_length_1379_cov_15.227344_1_plen_49_part_10
MVESLMGILKPLESIGVHQEACQHAQSRHLVAWLTPHATLVSCYYVPHA